MKKASIYITILVFSLLLFNFAYCADISLHCEQISKKQLKDEPSISNSIYEKLIFEAQPVAIEEIFQKELSMPKFSKVDRTRLINALRYFISYDRIESAPEDDEMLKFCISNPQYTRESISNDFSRLNVFEVCNFSPRLLEEHKKALINSLVNRGNESYLLERLGFPLLYEYEPDKLRDAIYLEEHAQTGNHLNSNRCITGYVYPIELFATIAYEKVAPEISLSSELKSYDSAGREVIFNLIIFGDNFAWAYESDRIITYMDQEVRGGLRSVLNNIGFLRIIKTNFSNTIPLGTASCEAEKSLEETNRARKRTATIMESLRFALTSKKYPDSVNFSPFGINLGRYSIEKDCDSSENRKKYAFQRRIMFVGIRKNSDPEGDIMQAIYKELKLMYTTQSSYVGIPFSGYSCFERINETDYNKLPKGENCIDESVRQIK